MNTIIYAPRVVVHPDRYGSLRDLPPRLVVIHTTEGPEGEGSAEQLAEFLTRPGDRVTASGSTFGSSYHAIADTALRVIPAVTDNRVAYSAPGSNTDGLHIVIPGRAGQSTTEWMAGSTRSAITTVAAYILDMRDRYGIPARRLSVAQIREGASGYCDHAAIAAAYGKTTHWDVGPNFPWNALLNDIETLQAPEPAPEPVPGPTPLPITPPEGAPEMFIVIVTNAPSSPVAETWLLCDGTQLSHLVDGHAATLFVGGAKVGQVRPDTALQVAGLIKSCRTMNDCPPEWNGTGWQSLWTDSRS